MAKDAVIIIANPAEPLKATNGRIREACRDTEVTGAHLAIISGVPIVTLTAETVEMEDDEIAELKEAAKTDADAATELKELEEAGYYVPASDPLIVVVRRLLLKEYIPKAGEKSKPMNVAEACAFTEDSLNDLLAKADGSVDSLQFVACPMTHEAYVLVSFRRDDETHAGEPVAKDA